MARAVASPTTPHRKLVAPKRTPKAVIQARRAIPAVPAPPTATRNPRRSSDMVLREMLSSGKLPLEVILEEMREAAPSEEEGKDAWLAWKARRLEAAKIGAPYLHPKLQTIEHKGDGQGVSGIAIQIAFQGENDGRKVKVTQGDIIEAG